MADVDAKWPNTSGSAVVMLKLECLALQHQPCVHTLFYFTYTKLYLPSHFIIIMSHC